LAAFRTCRQVYEELTKHFYNNQTLRLETYNVHYGEESIPHVYGRSRAIVKSIRPETRLYFKKLDINLQLRNDPNERRHAQSQIYPDTDPNAIAYATTFEYIIQLCQNIESVTVSFNPKWKDYEKHHRPQNALKQIFMCIGGNVGRRVDLKWDIRIKADPYVDSSIIAVIERTINYWDEWIAAVMDQRECESVAN
jgi:hypothetical protein